MAKKLSIIYVHYKIEKLLINSIRSVFENTITKEIEVIVIDNSNSPILITELKKFRKNIAYFNLNKSLGFGKACNLGIKNTKGKYHFFINPGTKITKGASDSRIGKNEKDKNIGVLWPKIIGQKSQTLPLISTFLTKASNITVYSCLATLWKNNPILKKIWFYDLDKKKEQKGDVINSACMMIPKNVFYKVKGFDEKLFMYFEEQDLCLRIKKLVYKVVFFPKIIIIHIVGQSLNDKAKIKKNIEKSGYEYSKKLFGQLYVLVSHLIRRYINLDFSLFLMLILISFSLNTYRIDELMLFIGDMARDYLVAREFILGGQFPLVGIPSSVVWLHQGPTSIWLISLVLKISNFNPVAPAVVFGAINSLTAGLIYYFGKSFFNKTTGFISSLLFISAPLAVVNARMPYHTSLVPFFAVVFFLSLPYLIKKKSFHLIGLLLGLLLLVELSNIVVFGILIVMFLLKEIKLSKKNLLTFFTGLSLGVLPFIMYDFLNGPTYLKFPVWIVYRVTQSLTGTARDDEGLVNDFLTTLYQQVSGTIMPYFPLISILILALSVVVLLYKYVKNKEVGELILTLWITVSLLAFLAHNRPGTAYFSLLYPAFSLAVGYLLAKIFIAKIAIFIAVTIFILNTNFLISNDFFVNTNVQDNPMPPTMYSFGNTYKLSLETSKAIVDAADGGNIKLEPVGVMKLYKTSLDPYRYFIWYLGGSLSNDGRVYIVSESKRKTQKENVIFQNRTDQVAVYD